MIEFTRWGEWLPALMEGLGMSAQLTLVVALLGLPLGLVLGVAATAKNRLLSLATITVVEIFRGVPLLVVIYFVYFGFPSIGWTTSDFVAVVIAMTVNLAAYSSEVFRAGLLHVPSGQVEAARSLGLTGANVFFRVVLPQAMKAIPGPLMSQLILLFQATSLAFAIGVAELTNKAFEIGSLTFDYLSVLVLAGAVYAVFSIATSLLVGRIERKARA